MELQKVIEKLDLQVLTKLETRNVKGYSSPTCCRTS